MAFEYRQNSDLYYLTGTREPGSVLVLAPGGITIDDETVTELLLVPPRDPKREIWTGRLLGPELAEIELGIEAAASLTQFERIIPPLLDDENLGAS